MSKGNLFLGFGRGKVGDIVFSHVNGEQVTRARNRAPRNPQTPLQLVQRVIMKTSALGYSLLQDICNHSFQGCAEGTESQIEFTKRNVEYFRLLCADEINSGEASDILASNKTNFSFKSDNLPEINPYIVSAGTITKLPYKFGADAGIELGSVAADVKAMTYQQVVDALGIQQGDQITFMLCALDDAEFTEAPGKFVAFEYARIILEPANGDMTTPFFDADNGYVIKSPNPKNEGILTIKEGMVDGVAGTHGIIVQNPSWPGSNLGRGLIAGGFAAIASRFVGGVWQRSNAQLALNPTGLHLHDYNIDYLGDAVQSFLDGVNSSLYLNQATV